MSTQQLYLIFDISTDANFRLWGKGISDQLTTCGWTKTTDTGQVDWSTTTAPGTINTYRYEIRKPASDALQTGATAYYIKIEFGCGNTTNCPSVRVTIGTGTDGAGTLTGLVSAVSPFGASAGPQASLGSVPFECNFSWDNSRLGMMLWRNISSTVGGALFFGVERTKNSDGTDSSEGVTLIGMGSTNNNAIRQYVQQTIVFGSVVGNNSAGLICLRTVSSITTDAINNNVPVSPVFPDYGKFGSPMTVAGACCSGDAVEGALVTTTLYSSTRTYLLSKALVFGGCIVNAGLTSALAMRFD